MCDTPDENELIDEEDNYDSSSTSSNESSVDFDNDDVEDVDFRNLLEDANTTNEYTKRLSVEHFDFDHYSLEYLASMIKSNLPKGGKILSITKYPTEYGIERLEDDVKFGPKEFLRPEGPLAEYDSDASEDSIELSKANRKYQNNRLKYFRAVFEFDSVESSRHICNLLDEETLEDTGLMLDLRYVDDDRQFIIPDNFLHLVKSLRPSTVKTKQHVFRPSQFSKVKVTETWDETPQEKLQFRKKAFEQSDGELSDIGDYFGGMTESEYSGSEAEINDDDNDGPKILKSKRTRMPVEEYRKVLGLDPELKEDEEYVEDTEDKEIEEDIEDIKSINDDDSNEEDSIGGSDADVSDDGCVVTNDEVQLPKSNKKEMKNKRTQEAKRRREIIKEKLEKKDQKLNDVLDYMKHVAEDDDRFDEFMTDGRHFQVIQTHSKYDNAKMLLEMMKIRQQKISKSDLSAGDNNSNCIVANQPPKKKTKRR